ncbi:amidohydrolase family protein [Bradyrhizobium sp. 193]|uniref:amidohydrolase family protein n=1 Tax=Bradyrhizobium sp. 193 TaxID=2782661 RepID=UPI001FFAA49E|nr:amidohydrolase family protein [Bradyrhizobium sp. 193]MCK1487906.1 amidohydrolase family protein [Bradyrhizobium sp. 193]
MNTGDFTAHAEPIIEPDLAICDTHFHLWDYAPKLPWPYSEAPNPYMLPELLSDLSCGHNVKSLIYTECVAFYRADGPDLTRPVGEVEFAGGVAAIAASGRYGNVRICEGIVGRADLGAGAAVADVLESQMRAGNGRFKGVRCAGAFDPSPDLAVLRTNPKAAGLYDTPNFREGFRKLVELGLSFDAWQYHTQIGDVVRLADAFPDARIVLDHCGGPLAIGPYANKQDEVFAAWRPAIEELAKRQNVYVKLGGLGYYGMDAFGFWGRKPKPGSKEVAAAWRPYIETCIEAFGAKRSMFESNYPIDAPCVDYATVWNAFKLITAGASADEKASLFEGAARRFYRLD